MKKIIIKYSFILLSFAVITNIFGKYDIREIERQVNYQFKRLKSSNDAVRMAAIRELSKISHKKTLTPLIYALNDKNVFIRTTACKALGDLAYNDAVKPLIRLLDIERELFVQKEALLALGKLGDERSRHIVNRFLKNNDITLRNIAKKVLEQLDNRP
ncbi:MAG: HEAT repeat domain-containing protein [Spirochaetota bacterium]|nr:HEAT repeat domain-containing protein [Spirochaetota bacterium]